MKKREPYMLRPSSAVKRLSFSVTATATIVVVLCFGTVSGQAVPGEQTETDKAPADTSVPEIQRAVDRMLSVLREEGFLNEKLDAEKKLNVLRGIVRALECPARIGTGKDIDDNGEQFALHDFSVKRNKYVYADIGVVDERLPKELKQAWDKLAPSEPEGIILDFRNVTEVENISVEGILRNWKPSDRATAVLINRNTSDDLKPLINKLSEAANAYVLADPSDAHVPYTRSVEIGEGLFILLPPEHTSPQGYCVNPALVLAGDGKNASSTSHSTGAEADISNASHSPRILQAVVDVLVADHALHREDNTTDGHH